MQNAIHQTIPVCSRMWSEQVLSLAAWPELMATCTRFDAEADAGLYAVANHHRYPEPVDEPPPDVEPIPPELPQPQPSPPDPTPGEVPMKAGPAKQPLSASAIACPTRLMASA